MLQVFTKMRDRMSASFQMDHLASAKESLSKSSEKRRKFKGKNHQ